jgi:hypothetical protein
MRDMTARMDFWMPREMADLLAEASRRRLLSKSDYARQALIEKLERDGVRTVLPTTCDLAPA